MRNSKWIVSAAIAISAMVGAGAASAADLAARPYTKAAPMTVDPVYNWSGFYIGGNGGYGSSRNCWNTTGINGGGGIQPVLIPDGCHNATGGTVGGQLGYRVQSSAWVFGVEAQGDWTNLNGNGTSVLFGGTGQNNGSKIDGLGLLTGQIGYAWNSALLYVKGGAAVTHDKFFGTLRSSGVVTDAASETRWGGIVGVGAEYSFTPNWSLALEYDHLFMGTHADTFLIVIPGGPPVGTPSRSDAIRQDVDMVTARINYRFGGPVVARY